MASCLVSALLTACIFCRLWRSFTSRSEEAEWRSSLCFCLSLHFCSSTHCSSGFLLGSRPLRTEISLSDWMDECMMLKLEVLFFISRLCCELFSVCADGVCLVDVICRWCFSSISVSNQTSSSLLRNNWRKISRFCGVYIVFFFCYLRYIDGSGRGQCHPHLPLVWAKYSYIFN